MKRSAGVLLLVLTALGGCVSSGDHSPWTAAPAQPGMTGGMPIQPPMIPGVQGSWGTPVPAIAPSAAPPGMGLVQNSAQPLPLMPPPPSSANAAAMASSGRAPNGASGLLLTSGLPPADGGVVRAGGMAMAGAPSGVVQTGGTLPPPPGVVPAVAPPGVSPFPGLPGMPMAGPGAMPMPGMPGMPGMPMPGMPGMPNAKGLMQVSCPPPGAVAMAPGVGGPDGGPGGCPPPPKRTEVRFAGPAGMKVSWYSCGPDGHPTFAGNQIEAPGRYNFLQAAIYRLKLSDIPGRPGVDLYPTLEVVPANFKTDAFLAHSAVPVYFTEEDLDQVAAGNYLVKVIYLPFPQYADVATTGPDEVVSTRLEPGADPIAEACRRGSILLVIRVGNIDLEAPNTPAMDAPPNRGQGGPPGPMCGPMLPPGAMMPGAGMARGPAMPMMPALPMARPGAMLPNGGQLPSQPLMAPPTGPGLGAPPAPPAKPTGPVTSVPDGVPSVRPVWFQQSAQK